MQPAADLEIGLQRHASEAERITCTVEFRYTQPNSDAETRLRALACFDLPALRELRADSAAYGRALGEALFADPGLRQAFAQARAAAATHEAPLRFRLAVGPGLPELHALPWETLCDPSDGAALCTSEMVMFSRYLSSADWRPVRLRPKGALKALALVANPQNLADFQLDPLDPPAELERIRAGLGQIPLVELDGPGQNGSLDRLLDALRDEAPDVLYLVCHARYKNDQTYLFLEDGGRRAAITPGAELVTRLKEMQRRPRLVVLLACQSAGAGASSLSALGPLLAEAGVPAVAAMQDNVSFETMAEFMPVLFEELARDGQVDRAFAAARGAVRDRHDAWAPALFMRLKSGRLWYTPGFSDERAGFERWPALLRSIKRGQCTPVLGHGLVEPLVGSQQEIARRWAEAYHYPMAPAERESLPQVAQFLSVDQDERFPYDSLEEALQEELRENFPQLVSAQTGRVTLDRLISHVGAERRKANPTEPHRVLAGLPLPLYITTNVDNLLSDALKEAGKDPQVVLCPWNRYIAKTETVFDREPDYIPSPERPLVYHLFGRLDDPDSIVLTEDDYFDYLMGVTGNKELIPFEVRRALADSALLFAGFRLDDWAFRILLRSILSAEGGDRRARYGHIAAQIEPEEGRILSPDRARRYMEKYFSMETNINLYWGSAEDFMEELDGRIKSTS